MADKMNHQIVGHSSFPRLAANVLDNAKAKSLAPTRYSKV
jgi:hypothetical protein